MRRIALSLGLLAFAPFCLCAQVMADETGTAMADAAARFIAALDEKQKATATFPFDSPERFNWHWIPRERKGLPFKAMTPEQRALAFGLLNTGLSTKGMLKATTIMSLEEILRVQEHGTGPVRDPELYFASVFGTPGDESGWAWRIEGHHLALNFTLKGARVISATPFMFGSNPAQVRNGSRKGLRNLAEIEAPVNELVLSLSTEQRKMAVVSEQVPDVTTTPNSSQPPSISPEGISSENLNPDQRNLLNQYVEAYYANFPEPIRADLRQQLARGAGKFSFAWFGPPDPTKPHAFRLLGPTLYIDFNEKQDEANHIHTFYRSLLGDFGATIAQ